MALAVEQHWPADAPLEGVVITRYGHGLPTKRIRVVEAGHPVPDEQGEAAAREILAARAARSGPTTSCCVLVSGGGSALLSLPVGRPCRWPTSRRVTRELLASGAPIQDMNTVRKHLSRDPGRAARRCDARARARARDLRRDRRRPDAHRLRARARPIPRPSPTRSTILERFGVDAPAVDRAHLDARRRAADRRDAEAGRSRASRASRTA